jgi:ABC-type dipeptide/oligopeptide/nickel transport system permease subunit
MGHGAGYGNPQGKPAPDLAGDGEGRMTMAEFMFGFRLGLMIGLAAVMIWYCYLAEKPG